MQSLWRAIALIAAPLLVVSAACTGPVDPSDGGPAPLDGGTAPRDGGPGADAGLDPYANVDDLSVELEADRAAAGVPALAAGVMQGTELVALGAAGERQLGSAIEVTRDDRFHLGSNTKSMTATLAAILHERGALLLETTMAEAFPTFAESIHADFAGVTIEQMLAHRGGAWGSLADHLPVVTTLQTSSDPIDELRRWFAEQVLTGPPDVPPGEEYLYSNSGFMIVGAALEVATGMTWEDLMTTEVFGPLGMASCGFGAPGTTGGFVVDEPWGHAKQGDDVVPVEPGVTADNPKALGPAGTVHCALADWGRYLGEHVVGEGGDGALLSAATYARLHSAPAGGDYGFGWVVMDVPWASGPTVWHNGSNTFWYAVGHVVPSEDRALFAATNIFGAEGLNAVDLAMERLREAYVP